MALVSPCTDVCKFDRKVGVCVGCFRTTDEIRQWRTFTDHRRHQIMAERRRREERLAARKTPLTVR
jgi:predicted Fe-S protein YdhL (DUF1289 family)